MILSHPPEEELAGSPCHLGKEGDDARMSQPCCQTNYNGQCKCFTSLVGKPWQAIQKSLQNTSKQSGKGEVSLKFGSTDCQSGNS